MNRSCGKLKKLLRELVEACEEEERNCVPPQLFAAWKRKHAAVKDSRAYLDYLAGAPRRQPPKSPSKLRDDEMEWLDATPGVCGGRPVIKGTRVEPSNVYSRFVFGASIGSLRSYFATRPLTTSEVECAIRYCIRRRIVP